MKRKLLFLMTIILSFYGVVPCKANDEPPVFLGYNTSGCFYRSLEGTEIIRVVDGVGEQFHNGLARVRNDVNKQTAVYNNKGNLMIPWTEMRVNITPILQGFSIITLYSISQTDNHTESYLYSQHSGTVIKINQQIDMKYIQAGPPFWYVKDNLYGLMDGKGEALTPAEFSIVSEFINGYAFVSGDTFHGYIGMQGEKKCEVSKEWSYSYGIYDGTMVVSRDEIVNGRYEIFYNVIDLCGNVLLLEDCTWCSDQVSDGWILVQNEDLRLSYLNVRHKGKMSKSWKKALDFANEFAAVQDDKGNWGFIDVSGELVIPFQFDYVGTSRDGFDGFDQFSRVWVSQNGDDFMIDKTGACVSPQHVEYAGCYYFNKHPIYLIVNPANQMGVLDSYGKVVLDTSFDFIELSNDQYLCGNKDGYLWYYDLNGQFVTKYADNKCSKN